jgi:L-seryl-tRNA(Ser) seleniumtransferase
MLTEKPTEVRRRAELLAATIGGDGVRVVPCVSTVGGGSMPGHELPSFAVEMAVGDPTAMAARLRTGTPPVFCRVADPGVAFDARTVGTHDVADLARAIGYALEGAAHAPRPRRAPRGRGAPTP